jgi:nitrite reductase/ring-hydroxylating ferredoxin subunit
MAEQQAQPNGPDLTQGVDPGSLNDDKLVGHVGDDEVLLVRDGANIFAVGAHCSHYHGPLADGLVIDGAVRCPWHHACFDLRTGEAVRAPAFSALDIWNVEQRDGRIFVRGKREQPASSKAAKTPHPEKIVIVGGGAAGFAAAEMLRGLDYMGCLVLLSIDNASPVDRPNLS